MGKNAEKKRVYRDEVTLAMREFDTMNQRQEQQWTSMDTDGFVFATGYAGTGKTYVACAKAVKLYLEGKVDKIVITKPMVDVERDFGALPGEIDEKFGPWIKSVTSILVELMGKGKYEYAVRKEKIEIAPLNFCRGLTYDNAFIIVDEAQNLEKGAIKMLMTRIGVYSTMVFCGDTNQIDLKGGRESGLVWMCSEIVKQQREIDIIRYQKDDCVRSGPCRLAIDIIEAAES